MKNKIPKLGAFEIWKESEDAQKYAGKHVAWLEEDGSVVASDSLDEIMLAVKAQPKRIIGFIPQVGFPAIFYYHPI